MKLGNKDERLNLSSPRHCEQREAKGDGGLELVFKLSQGRGLYPCHDCDQ